MKTKKVDEVIELNIQAPSSSDVSDIVFLTDVEEDFVENNNDIVGLNIQNSILKNLKDFTFVPGANSESQENESTALSDDNLDLIVNRIASAMTKVANQGFKGSTFIEPCEIESVKKDIFVDQKIDAKKRAELENELTKFQEEITTNYKEAINDYNDKRIYCETQIEMFEHAKKEIVMRRAAQMLWPFDEKTRSYDNKIAALKIQASRYAQKVADIVSMRPAASEKDLMMFQVQLREKFSA